MRILIVEDKAPMRRIIHDVLQRQHVEIHTAENCYETQCMLQENTYDWVTLDLSLPDGKGTDILEAIQSRHPDTRVVVISLDVVDSPLRKQLLSLGAAAVFPKPFNPGELNSVIYRDQG